MCEEGLKKIYIDLPNHWAIGGESMWAKPLGNNLFKIKNIPFYVYGLNFHDIVRATADPEELKPRIRELVEPSGHKTFRVFFNKDIKRGQQEKVLDLMKELTISYERANDTFFSLDMEPTGNYQGVFDRLEEFEKQNILDFETCEARVKGSFDDTFGEEE